MPEWNLVNRDQRFPGDQLPHKRSEVNMTCQRNPLTWVVLARVARLMLAVAVVCQVGCSKLRNSALQDSLVPPSQNAIAQSIDGQRESTRNYIGQKVKENGSPEARIVRSVEPSDEPMITMTAAPSVPSPAPSIASASNSIEAFMGNRQGSNSFDSDSNGFSASKVNTALADVSKAIDSTKNQMASFAKDIDEANCDHEGTCDCHKKVLPPKLAKVIPIDPATLFPRKSQVTEVAPSIAAAIKTTVAPSSQAAAARLAYHADKNDRLTPILLASNNSETTAVPQENRQRLKALLPMSVASQPAKSNETNKTPVIQAATSRQALRDAGNVRMEAMTPIAGLPVSRPPLSTVPNQPVVSPSSSVETALPKPGSRLASLSDIRVRDIDAELASENSVPTTTDVRVDTIDSKINVPNDQPRLSPKVEPITSPMITVTPKIIIQKEEEERPIGFQPLPPSPVKNDRISDETSEPFPAKLVDDANSIERLAVTEPNKSTPCDCGSSDCIACGQEPGLPFKDGVVATTSRNEFSGNSFADNNFSPLDACACGVPGCDCQAKAELKAELKAEPEAQTFSQPNPQTLAQPYSLPAPPDFAPADAVTNNFSSDFDTQATEIARQVLSRTNDFDPADLPKAATLPSESTMPDFNVGSESTTEAPFDRNFENVITEKPVSPDAASGRRMSTRTPIDIFNPDPSMSQALPSLEEIDKALAVTTADHEFAPAVAPEVSLQQQVTDTISKIKTTLTTETDAAARNGLEVNLQLLELLKQQSKQLDANDRMINNDQKRSLQHQLDALSAMLGQQGSSAMNASETTLDSLKYAVEELESLAELRVTNGLFCTQISGFGKFKPFSTSTFSSSQRMLIYCEVENQTSVAVNSGIGAQEYRTQLQGSYVIYDRDGQAVQREAFAPINDVARNRRRDFYVYFPMQLKQLPAGEYRLELMIEDLHGSKTSTLKPGIHFEVE